MSGADQKALFSHDASADSRVRDAAVRDQPQRRLPTAHACFNHLLLPRYDNEETLQGRFATAMKNTEKFGLQ
tara:strand:+ start:165 stop:380 length:216 start_codon:yes stop_codon:yes gene_type:complete